MNAVVALCHFCEMHGPSVVICTQAIQRHEAIEITDGKNSSDPSQENSPSRLLTPSESSESDAAEVDTFESHDSVTSNTCSACRSFSKPNHGLITYGDGNELWYLTLQYPHSPEVFTFLRQACVRSLSSEISPGREGVLFFGDEQHGYVYSFTFHLKDNEARGLQRWYSIIVLSMDRISLLQSWPFLTRSSRSLVSLLQEQAERTYGVDQAERPQRAARLNPSAIAINPGNFRRQRRGKAMRSLPELTLDSGVFHVLHEHFTHLLQLGGNQMSETLLEGAPSCYYHDFPTEETPSSPTQNSEDGENESPKPGEKLDLFPRFFGIVHLFHAIGKASFRSLAHNLIIGNQVIVRGYHDFLVASVIKALSVLIPPGCCKSIEFSQTYAEPWNCNLLGLHPDASLPNHVLTSTESYFVVDILAAKMNEMNVDKYKIITPTQATSPVKPSSYLLLVEHILQEVDMVEEVAMDLIRNQHEHLMTKAKVLYKLFRTESRSATQLPAVMDKFRITPEDDVVLKFWMTALSPEYKTHLKELSALPTPSSATLCDRSRRRSIDNSPSTPVSFQPTNVERSRTRKISLVNR